MTTAVTLIGGPTVLLEWAGLRIVTDPTFDAPQTYAEPGSTTLVKTRGPAIARTDLGAVDLVLLSHHQHKDNLDWEGLELVALTPLTLSTRAAASDLWGGGVVGLDDWEAHELPTGQRITIVPAQHRPPGQGDVAVCGFVLEARGEPTVYFSGDNRSIGLVEQIAQNFPGIRIAVLNAGAARVPAIDGQLTLTSTDAVAAARALGASADGSGTTIVGVHCEDWEHFSEGRAELESAFAEAGLPLTATPRGERVDLA